MQNDTKIHRFLQRASQAYYDGFPIISDEEFDYLAMRYSFEELGAEVATPERGWHFFPMYSLQKIYDNTIAPIDESKCVKTNKLDGAAISLYYMKTGHLVEALTRGDGERGKVCTEQVIASGAVPTKINELEEPIQITGEILVPKKVPNARNVASGTLGLKDLNEVKNRKLTFIAYDMQPKYHDLYTETLKELGDLGFLTVIDRDWSDLFETDGEVFRLNNNNEFNKLGYTATHPKGAFARKKSSDVPVLETILRDVTWQVGQSGKVTPVAIFDEINIQGAKINRATLHNVGIIEEMNLDIGDTILVTRRGGIIPQIIGKL